MERNRSSFTSHKFFILFVLLGVNLCAHRISASIIGAGGGGGGPSNSVSMEPGNSPNDRVKRGFFYDSTTRGYFCEDKCSKVGGTKYFWCHVNRGSWDLYGWDYCSPWAGQDYTGAPCKNECDYHGENYQWCYIKFGNTWGYCST